MSETLTSANADLDIVPYPPRLAAQYREAGYWGSLTIADELHATAERHPDAPAVLTPDTELSYAELDRRTDLIAFGLKALGLNPGDPVLLQVNNCEWAVLAWYGLLKAGLVPICTLPNHRDHELAEIARQAQPTAHLIQVDHPGQDLIALARRISGGEESLRVLLTIHASEPVDGTVAMESLEASTDPVTARAAVAEIQAPIADDALAVLQLSGGTTSVPKLIPRLQAEYWYNGRVWAQRIRLDHESVVAHLLPVIHNAGIVCALHAAHAAGACFAMSAPDPLQFTKLAMRRPISHILLVRPIAQLIAATPELDEALQSLRVVTWADKKLSAPVIERYDTDSCRLTQMFGMGEGMVMYTPIDASDEIRHHTNGAPVCAMDEVRLLKPGTEEPVEVGEPGEFCARGPYTIRGYFRAAERNKEAFTSDGFYRTGDILVEVHADGGVWYSLEDRLKDLINRGGEKINAAEVEELLIRHPSIAAAALVAMPDERLGERACAFIVPSAPGEMPTLEEIQRFFDGLGVAKYKWPERLQPRDALPLTNVQKVNKVVLRAEVLEILAAEKA